MRSRALVTWLAVGVLGSGSHAFFNSSDTKGPWNWNSWSTENVLETVSPWLLQYAGNLIAGPIVERAVGGLAAGLHAGYNKMSCAVAECCVPGSKWIKPNFKRESVNYVTLE